MRVRRLQGKANLPEAVLDLYGWDDVETVVVAERITEEHATRAKVTCSEPSTYRNSRPEADGLL